MRVAVVGATGRIGRNTVQALQRNGHEAVSISRSSSVDAYLRTQDLVDMARRTFEARGEKGRLVPTWRGGIRHVHGRRGAAAWRRGPARTHHLRRLVDRRTRPMIRSHRLTSADGAMSRVGDASH
jgi:uncharacterized protein YbjT (DUF2867 family)